MLAEEFVSPFGDRLIKTFKASEFFYSIYDESPSHLRAGMIVDGTIVQILNSDMRVKLECNFEIGVSQTEVLEYDQIRGNIFKLHEYFFEGKPAKIRILSIDFENNESYCQTRDLSKRVQLEASMKETELNK